MTPVKIIINNGLYQLLQPLPSSITSFCIEYNPNIRVKFSKEQTPHVKAWFNDIIERLDTDYVSFNGVLIPSSDLNKFSQKD